MLDSYLTVRRLRVTLRVIHAGHSPAGTRMSRSARRVIDGEWYRVIVRLCNAATRHDAAEVGFRDTSLHNDLLGVHCYSRKWL